MLLGKICIIVGGVFSLLMALFHSRFLVLFNWREDFEMLTPINRRIIYTLHIALLLLFVVFGVLSLTYVDELGRSSGLAFGFNISYSLFWLWRAVWQVIYFKPATNQQRSHLRVLHYLLIAVFSLLFFTYAIPPLLLIWK